MRIEKMSDRAIAANQNELLEGWADTALFEEPEQAFNRNIHRIIRRFLTCGTVQDVRDSMQCFVDGVAIGDVALHNFQART
jgi:hypothetical protein